VDGITIQAVSQRHLRVRNYFPAVAFPNAWLLPSVLQLVQFAASCGIYCGNQSQDAGIEMRKPRTGRRKSRPAADLDDVELQSRVLDLFCAGKTVSEIQRKLKAATPPVLLNRWEPYEIVRRAAQLKRLVHKPPIEWELSESLKTQYHWLETVTVVHTSVSQDVSFRAAEKLLDIMVQHRNAYGADSEFHIGFAGGGVLEATARILARTLASNKKPLPKRLVFHSMVGRFSDDPATDPNSFAAHFTGQPMPIEVRFVGLMVPGFVEGDTANVLRNLDGIRQSYERVSEIDVIVTSAGGHWGKGCSRLHELFDEREDIASLKWLESAGCIGDLMWCPLARTGPIKPRGLRAMTLVQLDDLPGLVAQRTRIMLVLGPCVTCGLPKADMLDAVLNLSTPLITDLVVDSHAVHQLIRNSRAVTVND
jgi:DNA-binding transcriptional regulator LsrR (DeoR family)